MTGPQQGELRRARHSHERFRILFADRVITRTVSNSRPPPPRANAPPTDGPWAGHLAGSCSAWAPHMRVWSKACLACVRNALCRRCGNTSTASTSSTPSSAWPGSAARHLDETSTAFEAMIEGWERRPPAPNAIGPTCLAARREFRDRSSNPATAPMGPVTARSAAWPDVGVSRTDREEWWLAHDLADAEHVALAVAESGGPFAATLAGVVALDVHDPVHGAVIPLEHHAAGRAGQRPPPRCRRRRSPSA